MMFSAQWVPWTWERAMVIVERQWTASLGLVARAGDQVI